MAMDKNIPDLLDRCADDISRDGGWIQGEMGEPESADAPVCAVGAIERHMSTELVGRGPKQLAHIAFSKQLGILNIPTWNDQPDRTAGEVADAFRTLAQWAREEQSS